MRRFVIAFFLLAQAAAAQLPVAQLWGLVSAGGGTIPAGVVAEYLFTSDLTDSSGNGYNGTASGNAQASGGTLILDGTGDYVTLSTAIDDNFSTGFSISTWIYHNNQDTEFIISNYNNSDGLNIRTSTDDLWFFIHDSGGGNYRGRQTTGNEILSNTWYHVVCVWDGTFATSGFKIYINNVQTDDADISAGTFNSFDQSGQPLTIGANPSSTGAGTWDGEQDNVRFYEKILTTEEIASLYSEGHD